jgi:outer membrane protein OmpA-like peptidoglycan-associated protein
MGYDKRDNAKEYSPTDGDTLKDIAKRESTDDNPLTWQEIARFNWGTDSLDDVDEFLRDHLGCYKRGSDKRFVISSDVDVATPLLIPQPFTKSGLATTKTHTIKVTKKAKPPKQFEACTQISGITFEFDSDKIRDSEKADVDKVADEMNEHPTAKAMIFGHTDKVGSESYNKDLSERRAKSVFTYLTTEASIDAGRFMDPKHMGCGEFNPVEETEEASEPNRRVTVFLFHPDRLPRLPCKNGSLAPCHKQTEGADSDNRDSFPCSFYDSLARNCPAEGGGPAPTPAVTIKLSQPVACPGLPLEMTAEGTPSGGTFKWKVEGEPAARLVNLLDDPIDTGDTVHLQSFKTDDTAGNIPEHEVKVSVTYTLPQGLASDSKTVKVHKIDFVVANDTVTAGITHADETAAESILRNVIGVPTMKMEPEVEIQLDSACPDKTTCASNHQMGFLQTVLTNDRRNRYTHTLVETTVDLPIRDELGGPAPFYDGNVLFLGDKDKQSHIHEDSPFLSATWADPRHAAPAPPPAVNRQLREMHFQNSFRAWLVVQNFRWGMHDKDTSFVFLRNFDWSVELNVTVDTSKAVGSRCTPQSNPPTIGAVGTGKGAGSPVLTDPTANDSHKVTITAQPAI